jgi:hypothetical protein
MSAALCICDEAIQLGSFRGDAKHRTRNLEIPGSLVTLAPRNDDLNWIASRTLAMTALFCGSLFEI